MSIEPNRAFTSDDKCTKQRPWYNSLQQDPSEALLDFFEVLSVGLDGASYTPLEKNIYVVFGYASQGYKNWDIIEHYLELWCEENDSRHKDTGWILLTNGDGDYGCASVETIAQYVSARGTPVVFIQSHFGHSTPGTKYWPTYASAGMFGTGKISYLKGLSVYCWGGYVRDDGIRLADINDVEYINSKTSDISYPDEVCLRLIWPFGSTLVETFGGIFVAGGGEIVRDQCELYRFLKSTNRPGDFFVPGIAMNGSSSELNAIYGYTCRKDLI